MVSILDIPDSKLTPGMKQYKRAKEEVPDCLVLLRMGDFYEIFYEDAKIAARDLQITLTARGKGEKRAPLAGIPYHALDNYLGKLVAKGHKVAIIEQLEDPKKAKGLVKRGLVRVVTPGTVIESSILDDRSNNYLASVFADENGHYFAVSDLSTGEFLVGNLNSEEEILAELEKRTVSECIVAESMMVNSEFINCLRDFKIYVSKVSEEKFDFDFAKKIIAEKFGEELLIEKAALMKKGFVIVAGALLSYMLDTQKNKLSHICELKVTKGSKIMQLDRSTIRNLELVKNVYGETGKGTLLSVIDKTVSSVGARLLKKVIKEPLLDLEEINRRLNAISCLNNNSIEREELANLLKQVYDLERLIARVNYGNASPKDLIALKESLFRLPIIISVLKSIESGSKLLKELGEIDDFSVAYGILNKGIKEDAKISVRDGGMIKRGFSLELDELLEISLSAKQYLQKIELKEKNDSGLSSVKIGFNRVFGYYLEVRKREIANVPEHYIRKQTTAQGERYITEELKDIEAKILGAQEKISVLEYNLFQKILLEIKKYTVAIQKTANKLAMLDVLCSFSKISKEKGYVKPEFANKGEDILEIVEGRHPVVETLCDDFIANNVKLNSGEIMIITGPNTSGKSTVMRQVALIVLMAQIGMFVPAKYCKLSLVDRIFTRVGAHDDLSSGQSTFMVEMLEAASIMNEATNNSLIILDEIGRGTSTFDGVAIAWSCVEHIYNKIGAKTMFATHYHVLNKLALEFEKIINFNVAVREIDGEIVYLRKLISGGCDQSHGVHVAKLAGMPSSVVERAKEIQSKLEKSDEMARKISVKKLAEQTGLNDF